MENKQMTVQETEYDIIKKVGDLSNRLQELAKENQGLTSMLYNLAKSPSPETVKNLKLEQFIENIEASMIKQQGSVQATPNREQRRAAKKGSKEG